MYLCILQLFFPPPYDMTMRKSPFHHWFSMHSVGLAVEVDWDVRASLKGSVGRMYTRHKHCYPTKLDLHDIMIMICGPTNKRFQLRLQLSPAQPMPI